MWIQTLVVFLVVAACASYVVRTLLGKLRPTASACGGCDGGCCGPAKTRVVGAGDVSCNQKPLLFYPPKR
jgi:hypothetical protein